MPKVLLATITLCGLLCFLSCNSKKNSGDSSEINAFYYWQTSLSDFNWTDSTYKKLGTKKIYYRFFDVDWSDEAKNAVPVSPLSSLYAYGWEANTEVVPVVFITNETFKQLDKGGAETLARHIHKKIQAQLHAMLVVGEIHKLNGDAWWTQDPYQMKSKSFDEQRKYDSLYASKMAMIKEVQFDCDWTKSTRENYFAFLREARKLFKDVLVTSTVRLYQYKYPKEAGVPPVERGMLMCYNAGSAKDNNARNSIFDRKEVMSYLKSGDYALPLDYALPIFEWALLFRDGKLIEILSTEILSRDYQQYIGERNDNKAIVTDDFVYGYTQESTYIRSGDEIRFEEPDMGDVLETASWLSENKNNKEAILALYHLNDYDLKKHSKEIENIFNSF
jgi:hypothetical protein